MVVIDENRLFDDNPEYVKNMMDLVQRDRNHPSVIIWSFCNERGCEGTHEQGGPSFQAVTTMLDGTRPTLANMFTFNDLLSNTVDVQGFSHSKREKLDACHSALPSKPIFMSECCSCNTMRGEDEGCETEHDNPHSPCDQKAFNGRCLEQLVNASDGVDYSAGTMVWTLFDYYGKYHQSSSAFIVLVDQL
jgi:beta-galactosidase/beta-glucuronidase